MYACKFLCPPECDYFLLCQGGGGGGGGYSPMMAHTERLRPKSRRGTQQILDGEAPP